MLDKIKEDYNLISDEFSSTRNKNWEELDFLAKNGFANKKILDLGCGNGRLYELFKFKMVGYYGIDVSEKMIEIAKERYPTANFRVGDALNLPFPEDFFDDVYGVAVFHHIPSENFRRKFLSEAKRVLKTKGKLFLTVWNFSAQKRLKLFLKNLILKPIGLSRVDFNDDFVGWGKKIKRYVHCFSKSELKTLVQEAGFKIKELEVIKRPKSKESNIVLIAEK